MVGPFRHVPQTKRDSTSAPTAKKGDNCCRCPAGVPGQEGLSQARGEPRGSDPINAHCTVARCIQFSTNCIRNYSEGQGRHCICSGWLLTSDCCVSQKIVTKSEVPEWTPWPTPQVPTSHSDRLALCTTYARSRGETEAEHFHTGTAASLPGSGLFAEPVLR